MAYDSDNDDLVSQEGDSNTSKMESKTSTSGDSKGGDSSSDEDIQRNLAKKESTAVFRLRVIVIIIMIITAVVVSAVVLKITGNGEADEFETQFEGAAHVVQEAFGNVIEKMSIIGGLAATAGTRSGDWPFVTLGNFMEHAANVRYLSGALSVHVCPLVSEEDRSEWEEFVNSNVSVWM